jgi:hypothetical protein
MVPSHVRAREAIPAPKEIVLHIQVATFLKQYLAEGWVFTHPASGEHRDKRTAAKLKAMGTMPGWPDLIFVSPEGRFHGLELKRRGEGLNDAQKAFRAGAIANGWPFCVVDNLDDAMTVLNDWGCLRVKIVGSAA